jgi:general secretion pathway protein J
VQRLQIKNNHGFTLIEIIIAIIIYSIIATISYRIVTSLIITKQVTDEEQNKWSNLSLLMSHLSNDWNKSVPLSVRDQYGNLIPPLIGKDKLSGMYDAQLELTVNGYLPNNLLYNTVVPPKRIGYRFYNNAIYLITWPVLHRVQQTRPEITMMMDGIKEFIVEYMYPDRTWKKTWPPENNKETSPIPKAFRLQITLKTGEIINRQWTL